MGEGNGDSQSTDVVDNQSAEVVLYTLRGCGACALVRRLLRRRRIAFEEIHGDGVPGFRQELHERTGRPTVPQVVIDGEPIGGADSLTTLDRRRVLLPRVRREPFPIVVERRRWLSIRLLASVLGALIPKGVLPRLARRWSSRAERPPTGAWGAVHGHGRLMCVAHLPDDQRMGCRGAIAII